MARQSDRRIDTVRRRILSRLDDPVLIKFARERKQPKEIALAYIGVAYMELKRAGRGDEADRLLRTKIRWVERRITRAI